MNTSTTQIENFKNFESELSLIERLSTLDQFAIQLLGHEDIQTRISKRGKDLDIEIATRLNDLNPDTELCFAIDKIDYEIKRLNRYSFNAKIDLNAAYFSSNYEINILQSKGFKVYGLFKTFYPVDLDEIKSFHTQFETVTHQRENTEYFYDCLRIDINGITFDITQVQVQSKGYYVFECLDSETFENYSETCFSIRQAMGFISKLMVGDEEYTFDESGKLYYSNYTRPTIKGMYSPITTNPYSYLDIEKDIADRFQGCLTRISLENFSNLVSKIHSDSDFSTAVLVILEVTSVRSLLLIPSSFAVIIELLAKAITVDETGLEVPIPDNNLKSTIIRELYEVIDRHSDQLNEESILKLKRRLNEINKPTNRQHLTNNEKLTRPFEQLGIRLSLHDLKIIEHRNDLLHGNILLQTSEEQTIDTTNIYMAYVSAKLYTLISKLILKSIGYSGYVYNQAKYLEKYMENNTTEEYFERI